MKRFFRRTVLKLLFYKSNKLLKAMNYSDFATIKRLVEYPLPVVKSFIQALKCLGALVYAVSVGCC